ncbi:MAG: ArsR family transcriptional regulator [Candidatus Methanoperedens sp.]|nr:ArsR family transcriptional regulator [Candidatus Methanoperedens sp.]
MGCDHTTMIFSTDNGIVAIDSPVKLKILELLRNGTIAFEELVEESGKAKSTISVHLDDLERLNLIQEKTHPGDKRKKYFVLNSLCLAFSETPLRNQYKRHLDDIAFSRSNDNSFIIHLFHTIRFGMEAYGFDPKPILKRLGTDIGIKIGPKFKADNFEGILKELPVFWRNHKLGDMIIIRNSEPVIQVKNCHHCCRMPDVGKTLCSMDEGILEGVFLSRLKLDYGVMETECFGNGYDHCKFVIEKK